LNDGFSSEGAGVGPQAPHAVELHVPQPEPPLLLITFRNFPMMTAPFKHPPATAVYC
jgi:hypothetical protein